MATDRQSQRTAGEAFEYRSAVFQTSTFGERARELFRHSPYFFIAVAINTTLIAVATVWKLSEERRRPAGDDAFRAALATIPAEPKNDPEPARRPIFDDSDVPIDPNDSDVASDAPELIPTDPSFVVGDTPETDNGIQDSHTAKGDSNSPLIGPSGDVFSNIIGVGSSDSQRGDLRGFGNGRGGNRNVYPRRRDHRHVSQRTESAVEAGLRWLARHQDSDGSWAPEAFTANCQGGTVCAHGKGFGDDSHRIGMTGLALLAFLGAGYDHGARLVFDDPFTHRKIRVGDVVRQGLIWLKDQQTEAGSIGEPTHYKWGYNHSIATLALCEAYGLSRAIQFRQPAQRAVNCLIAGQNAAPAGTGLWGWRYTPQSGDNDLSVTGWAVMALKSAELSGLTVAQDSLQGAFNFCEDVTDRTSGLAGYLTRADAGTQVKSRGKNDDFQNHQALAAVAMCIRTFLKHDINDPALEPAAKALARDLPAWDKQRRSIDYYYWYYGSLALEQYDGPDSPRPGKGQLWKEWEAALKKALLDNQVNNPKLCSDGSWDGDDRWGVDGGGRVYATAINTLTFEVYYRYGNAFGTVKKAPAPKK
jgi:hypothetical protein